MNLRQIRYFCALVEGGTLARAAERLFVAPTAISMQMSQLERDLGGELFNRAVRPMTPTALGRFLLPRARELLAHADRVEQDVHDRVSGRRGRLAIGFVRSLICSVVPRAVRNFRERHPGVKVELVEMLSEHQPDALRGGRIDRGLSRHSAPIAPPAGLQHTVLFADPYVAAVSTRRVPDGRSDMTLAELDVLPLVSYPNNPDSGYARQVLALLRAAGGHPVVGHEPIEIHTALGLVAADLGYAIVGASVAEEARRDVAFVALPEISGTTTIVAVTRSDEDNAMVDSLLTELVR